MANLLLDGVRKIIARYPDKRYIIFGAGEVGGGYYAAFRCLGYSVEYFVDTNKRKIGTKYYERPVKSPECLLYEDKRQIVVILGLSDLEGAEKILTEMGFIKGENFSDVENIECEKKADCFDVFLGFSRIDDIEGFKIVGKQGAGIRIITLGNSTTDYSMSNLKSWPEFCHEILDARGIMNHIYNGGMGGYHSGQELLKLLRDGMVLKPDIVVSFSGINEASTFWRNAEHPLIPNYLFKMVTEGIGNKKNVVCGLEHSISASDNWLNNMRAMHAICEEFHIKFYAFLQPCVWTGRYKLQKVEEDIIRIRYRQEEFEIYNAFYQDAKKEISKYDYIIDLTNIFDDMSGIYYDRGHCNETGNEIIAQKIADVITAGGK